MTVHAKNLNVAELVKSDIDHHFHPFTDHKAFHAAGGPRVMTQADGIWIWDAEGNKLLDGMSGLWCCNLGYSRHEIIEAVTRQLHELPFYNNFFQCAHPTSIELAQVLAEDGVFDRGLKFRSLVLPDIFIDQASPEAMYRVAGLDAAHIEALVAVIEENLGGWLRKG